MLTSRELLRCVDVRGVAAALEAATGTELVSLLARCGTIDVARQIEAEVVIAGRELWQVAAMAVWLKRCAVVSEECFGPRPESDRVAICGELDLVGPTGWLPDWLRDLLTDVAHRSGGLIVEVRDGCAVLGVALLEHRVIVVDHGEVASMLFALAHEIAHVCDVRLGSRTIADRERFANELARLMLKCEPRALRELLDLAVGLDPVVSPTASQIAESKNDELRDLVAFSSWVEGFK